MNIYILTFIITALFDVLLRYISLNRLLDYDFVRYLEPYFKQHTLLAAALIAGFVGATAQYFILMGMTPAPHFPVYGVDLCCICLVWICYEGYGSVPSP